MRGGESPRDDGVESMFKVGEQVFAYDSDGKVLDSVVKEVRVEANEARAGQREYLVHYKGWNNKWDAWVGTVSYHWRYQSIRLQSLPGSCRCAAMFTLRRTVSFYLAYLMLLAGLVAGGGAKAHGGEPPTD